MTLPTIKPVTSPWHFAAIVAAARGDRRVPLGDHRRAYNEHREIIKSLEQRGRIAYAYHMNRHLQAGLQFIAPKAV
ncbi:hypothetical protein [Rhizobium sp. NPDC090279]|uniref:hypothetical protein n=1 Tax=Rhizobium sp. NPDC090279 TaxID=3364499 RepID=UPI00383AFB7E